MIALIDLAANRRCTSFREDSEDWLDEELQEQDTDDNQDEILTLLDEVRERYSEQSVRGPQHKLEPNPPEQETLEEFEAALNRSQNENASIQQCCATCSKQKRVENVQSFRRGQHLAMPGKIGRWYNRVTRTSKHSYQHHAIVKHVKDTAGTRVKMELIHFTKERNKIRIYKTEETYDLANDEIMIVEYDHPRYGADEIVQRAESMIPVDAGNNSQFNKYNPFTRNCEHFATWCVAGESQSLQVHSLREEIKEGLRKIFGYGSALVKGILRLLFISSDEIAGAMTRAINVPEFVLGGAAALYLLYCIVMTVVHRKKYKSGHMCWSCLKGKLIDLWLAFGLFGATSAVTFVIFNFALPLMNPAAGIPLLIVLLLLSALLQWSVPKIRKALRSVFNADKVKIEELSELEVGDVLSMPYYGIPHIMILTEILEESPDSKTGMLRCVHYGLPNVLGKRKVIEEYFKVNLEKKSVKRLDCRHLLCYPGDRVVTRVRKRVGETKWSGTRNRSVHLSFWAKVRQRPRGICEEWDNSGLEPSASKTLSSLLVEKAEIHLMEELQVGDVVQHEKVGILANVVSLDDGFGRRFEIDLIFYHGWIVRSKKFQVNLNTDKVFVKKFHPAHCHPMDTRVQRARNWLDEKGPWWTTDGFIEDCITLQP